MTSKVLYGRAVWKAVTSAVRGARLVHARGGR